MLRQDDEPDDTTAAFHGVHDPVREAAILDLELCGLRANCGRTSRPASERQRGSAYRCPGHHGINRVTTGTITPEAWLAERETRTVAALKSLSFASKMFGTNVCGLRSITGNQVLCT